jgi:hypothetical protein
VECKSKIATLLPYLIFTNPRLEKGIRACFTNAKKIVFNLSALTGLKLDKDNKVQEADAATLFSQLTFHSTTKNNNDPDSDESNNTPKTINRSTPTAQIEALSSLSEGVSLDVKTHLELMTKALIQLTTMIPDTPENQASLNNISALFPPQSAGSSSGGRWLWIFWIRSIATIRPAGGGGIGQPPSTCTANIGPYGSDELEISWGDSIASKHTKNDKIRIIFWNCGGFPPTRDHPKNQVIRNVISKTEADIAAFAEVNLNWKKVKPHDRLQERTWGWFQALHTSSSFAIDFPAASQTQVGGTAIFTLNEYVHQVDEKTCDRLGRWCSTKLKGKGHTAIRFISAYQCIKNMQGPLSVWNQQRYLLDLSKDTTDPIKKFDKDLCSFLTTCMQSGEHIIVGINANSDTRCGTFTQAMDLIGLFNIYQKKFGDKIPPTYARGSTPIDALFVSRGLLQSQAGLLPVTCDHRVLWMDISESIALGKKTGGNSDNTPRTITSPRPTSRQTIHGVGGNIFGDP